jgi:hypothetical protein
VGSLGRKKSHPSKIVLGGEVARLSGTPCGEATAEVEWWWLRLCSNG